MRKAIAITLLLLVLFPVMAWVGFPWYLPWVANRLLADSGIEVVSVRSHRPDWQGLVIDSLEVAGDVDAHARNIALRRDEKTAAIQLTIDHLAVGLGQASTDNRQSDSAKLSDLLPEKLVPVLPSMTVDITTLEVSTGELTGDPTPLLVARNTQLRTDQRQLQLKSIADVTPLNSGPLELSIDTSTGNDLTILLVPEGTQVPMVRLQLHIDRRDAGLAATVDARFRQEQPKMLTLAEQEKISLSGELSLHGEMSITDGDVNQLLSRSVALSGQLQGNVDEQGSQSHLEAASDLHLSLDNHRWQLSLRSLSTSAEFQQTPPQQKKTSQPKPILLAVSTVIEGRRHQMQLRAENGLNLSGELSGSLGQTGESVQLDPGNAVTLAYGLDGKPVAQSQLNNWQWNGVLPGNPGFQLRVHSVLTGEISPLIKTVLPPAKFPDQPWQWSSAAVQIPAQLEFQDAAVTVKVEPAAQVTVKQLVTPYAQTEALKLKLPEQTLNIAYQDPLPEKSRLLLVASALTSAGRTFEELKLTVNLQREAEQLRLEAKNAAFVLSAPGQTGAGGKAKAGGLTIPPYKLVMDTPWPLVYDADGALERINLSLRNQCDQLLASGNLAAERHLQLQTSKTFNKKDTLAHWLDLPQLSSDLVGGHLQFALDWDIAGQALPKVEASLSYGSVTGSLGRFDGIQVGLSPFAQQSAPGYQLIGSIDSLNVGVEALNTEFQFNALENNGGWELALQKAQGQVFGGRLSVQPARWQAGEDVVLTVEIDQLDLAAAIGSQNLSGLVTTGVLNGNQPVKVAADGKVSLVKGTLINAQPGVIRYHSGLGESPGMNESLKFTMDVLENFNYQQLQTETAFQDGSLILSSTIVGRNPDVKNGQPVVLNLNTELQLGAAFQVMRMKAGLEAEIEKLVSQRSKSKTAVFCQVH